MITLLDGGSYGHGARAEALLHTFETAVATISVNIVAAVRCHLNKERAERHQPVYRTKNAVNRFTSHRRQNFKRKSCLAGVI
jgi:hypothetical protein